MRVIISDITRVINEIPYFHCLIKKSVERNFKTTRYSISLYKGHMSYIILTENGLICYIE